VVNGLTDTSGPEDKPLNAYGTGVDWDSTVNGAGVD